MANYRYEGAYRYKRYRRPLKIKKYVILIAVLAAIIGVAVYFQSKVTSILWGLSEATVQARAIEAVNAAALEAVRWNGVDYDKLVTITRDGEGNVLSIETDAQSVNLMARQAVTLAAGKLNTACKQGVKVPVGAFTGIEVLAGFGPKVTFRILPVGRAECKFYSDFRSAGINQTVHTIYMEISASVEVVMPHETREVSVSAPVLVCESVIVGKIPDVYLQGGVSF